MNKCIQIPSVSKCWAKDQYLYNTSVPLLVKAIKLRKSADAQLVWPPNQTARERRACSVTRFHMWERRNSCLCFDSMFEVTLSDNFWGDEDFTCSQCSVIFLPIYNCQGIFIPPALQLWNNSDLCRHLNLSHYHHIQKYYNVALAIFCHCCV